MKQIEAQLNWARSQILDTNMKPLYFKIVNIFVKSNNRFDLVIQQ